MSNIDRQKQLVSRFLDRCNAYADDMVDRYTASLGGADPAAAREIHRKIDQWRSYRAFNEHAIGELATDRLDDWFDENEDCGTAD